MTISFRAVSSPNEPFPFPLISSLLPLSVTIDKARATAEPGLKALFGIFRCGYRGMYDCSQVSHRIKFLRTEISVSLASSS